MQYDTELLPAWIHDNHVDALPSLERSTLRWTKIFKANLSRVDGVQFKSYIFDPEEVQSPGCIHEVNSYKHNEQGSSNPKFQENSETQEHNSALQKDELNRTENQNQVNSTNETLWNNGGNDFQEDGLLKCLAKPNVAVNGGNSCAGVHSVFNPYTNPGKEASEQGTSPQSEASLASNRDFYIQSNRSGQELDTETSRQLKAACDEPNSIQEKNLGSAEGSVFLTGSAILKTQNNVIQLPDVDYPQNENQTRNYAEKDSFSVSCGRSHQNTGPSAIQDKDLCVTSPSPVEEGSIEPFKSDPTSLSEGITAGTTAAAVSKAAQTPTHSNHKDLNGETEEEDAEVAAALAALEAATAGEDLEDDDEY
ncbi:uncharacterized protein C4orf19 homolog [Melanerpes formicivorus]|uniref:uncharacterized protein C4orf19 homolog n=1 Tax=Melanerpes formicivorus TaxID=211600 RepID=UPI00358F156D